MASTPILPLAVWQSGTNQNSIPANDNALRIEALNREIISQAVTAQPASPADGDTYIIAATHTGAQWATFTPKDIAIFKGGTWYAWAPTEGLIVNVAGSEFKYDGGAWVAIGGISGMANPMTASGDIIYGGTPSAGVAPPTRLAATTNGYVLTLTSGLPAWAPASGGFSNPMTTSGDLILGGASGAPGRLAIGANGTVLTVTAGVVGWQAAASGFANPMTTIGDLIVGGASGAAARLANGTAGQVLTAVSGAAPAWADPIAPTIPQNSKSAAYTLVLSDAGKHILHPSADTTARTFTIPANASVAFPIGTALTFVNQNGGGVVTIAVTTDTMRLAGAGTTGSRTLAANGIATALKLTSTEWIISGTGLT